MATTTDRRSRRARPGWRTLLGLVFLVTGLSLIGYVGWQMYGTNIVSHRKQHAVTASLEQRWQAGEDFTTAEGSTAGAVIRIPRFGKDYEVPVLEGTSDDVLAAGFGHFDDSAGVGEVGNYALAAHRVTHGEPLRGMPELRVGDTVLVETRTAVYTYVLDTAGADLVVPFTDTWVVSALPRNPEDGGVQPAQRKGQQLLTLTTCSELFHTDNRMIAFGHLQKTSPK